VLDRLRSLGKSFTVYGLGDVATSIISFLLLPLYARFLTPEDYGAIGLLLSVEVVAKIVFRFGLDAAFMRLYFDCPDDKARQRLASTLFWFLAAVGVAVLAVCQAGLPWLAAAMGVSGYPGALRIVLLNTFIIGFYFIPFHVLRIDRSADDVRRADDEPIGGDAADPLRADHRPRPRRDRVRPRRPGRCRRVHGGHAALVQAADPAGCSRARPRRRAALRPAARARTACCSR
jgi:hypothetical protein